MTTKKDELRQIANQMIKNTIDTQEQAKRCLTIALLFEYEATDVDSAVTFSEEEVLPEINVCDCIGEDGVKSAIVNKIWFDTDTKNIVCNLYIHNSGESYEYVVVNDECEINWVYLFADVLKKF